MRKLLGLLAAAAFMVVAVTSAQAFTGAAFSTKTASIAFTGTGAFNWDITVANVGTQTSTTTITWSSVVLGTTKWKNADQYVIFNTTITDSKAKIRVYSDNKHGVNYKYTGALTKDMGGLVNATNPSGALLAMGWAMSATTAPVRADNGAPITAVNPEDVSTTSDFFGVYLLDKSNSDFDKVDMVVTPPVNNPDYSQAINSGGIKFGGSMSDRAGSPSGRFYMFISASFANAVTPANYGCDTIIFQGYSE